MRTSILFFLFPALENERQCEYQHRDQGKKDFSNFHIG